jgi:diaminopimelate epimerase
VLGSGRPTGPVTVVLDGGELEVEVGEDLHVELSGWAVPVFEGQLSEDFLAELQELDEQPTIRLSGERGDP